MYNVFHCLLMYSLFSNMLQMTELKKYNNQLFKELSETKSYVENIKEKLAQCKHNTPTDYQPGMLSGTYNFKI